MAKYSNTPVTDVFIGILPQVITHLIAIAILLVFPGLSLWLHNRM